MTNNDYRGIVDTAIKLTQRAFRQLQVHDLAGFLRLGDEAEKALVFLELQPNIAPSAREFITRTRRELAEMRDDVLTTTIKLMPTAGDA